MLPSVRGVTPPRPWNAQPVLMGDGSLLGAIVAWQDISTIKEMDGQKDEFLAPSRTT